MDLDRGLPPHGIALRGRQWKVGQLFVPLPELLTLGFACASRSRHVGGAALHRPRQGDARHHRGRADRGGVRRQREAARLLLSGLCAAFAAVAGMCLALSHTLAPVQIYAWMGVVFAAVMIGGLGNPLGPLVAGIVIGVSEGAHHGGHRAGLGAAGVVLAPDRRAAPPAGEILMQDRRRSAIALGARRLAVPRAAGVLRVVPVPPAPRGRARHLVELSERLLRLLLLRPRRVLRRRRLYHRGARRQARLAVPVDAAARRASPRAARASRSAPSSSGCARCAASCSRCSRSPSPSSSPPSCSTRRSTAARASW